MNAMSPLKALAALVLLAPASGVCSVPVFRYALERWPASPYETIVFHRGPLSAEDEAVLREIQESVANARVWRADLSGKLEGAIEEIWKGQGDPALPWMVVRYPESEPATPSAWVGRPDAASVRALLDSPARREVVRRLLLGESAVWLLLECGDADKDDEAARKIESELEKLEKVLRLPVDDPDMMPLLSDVPLKIDFSVLRLSRKDPAERGFVGLLERSGDSLSAEKGPVALPVFGRGRALWPLSGDDIGPAAIAETAEFLVGPCSCQVKEMNPGMDLLFTADWEELLSNPPGEESPDSPPEAAVPAEVKPPAASGPKPEPEKAPVVADAPSQDVPSSVPSGSLKLILGVIAVVALAVLGAGVLILRPRSPSAAR